MKQLAYFSNDAA